MTSEIAISLPFTIDSFGVVGTTQEQSKIWADRVRSILGTSLRERVMRPTLGTLIPFGMFEQIDTAESEIQGEISKAFSRQLPLLTLSEVIVTHDEYTNTLSVTVVYELPNNEQVTTVLGFVGIRGNLPLYEELS